MGAMKFGNDKFDFVFIFFYFSTNIEARTQMLLILKMVDIICLYAENKSESCYLEIWLDNK